MVTVYRLNADELSVEFLNSVKHSFKHKVIQIVVSDTDTVDETEYLLATSANRKSLEKAMQEAESNELVIMTVEELAAKYGKQ